MSVNDNFPKELKKTGNLNRGPRAATRGGGEGGNSVIVAVKKATEKRKQQLEGILKALCRFGCANAQIGK